MLANSHKVIAKNIYNNVFENYGLKLNKDKLIWGSIAPDILPKYRFIRHYKDESLDYIVNHISMIIFASRYVNFNKYVDVIALNVLSREIGIISHYLSDFVCAPHAKRWTFIGSMKKHISYERELSDYIKGNDIKKHIILTNDINLYDNQDLSLKEQVRLYIDTIIEEYSVNNVGFETDLNFAADINNKISYFILNTINEYSEELQAKFIIA